MKAAWRFVPAAVAMVGTLLCVATAAVVRRRPAPDALHRGAGSTPGADDAQVQARIEAEVRRLVWGSDAPGDAASGGVAGAGGGASAKRADGASHDPVETAEAAEGDAAAGADATTVPIRIGRPSGAGERVGGAPPDYGEDAGAEAAIARAFESCDAGARAAAMETVAAAWPRSRPALEQILREGSDAARLDAARLLRDARLGDTSVYCAALLADGSDAARIQALRAVYDKRLRRLEPRVRALVTAPLPWDLRQEAVRALERIGGTASLPALAEAFRTETEPSRRGRLRRALRAVAHVDLGDDPDAWANAAWGVRVGGGGAPSAAPTDAAKAPRR